MYWGEVGPDASADNVARGPKGYDEWNQARSAGNFGWPYFVGNNKPYVDYDFATLLSTAPFDANSPVNDSPNNTGPTNLPPAQAAWLWYPYDNSPEFPELNGPGGRTAMGGPVYHFSTNVTTKTKLPAYFDQTLFVWEWSRGYIKEIKIDDDGNPLKINPFLSSFPFLRPIDLKIGPDGVIYLIEWGTGFGGGNSDAVVERIDYLGARPNLRATSSASKVKFSWSVDAAGYVLEQSAAVGPNSSWTQLTNEPVLEKNRFSITLPVSNPNQFFRLRK
jgi:hypothetical protein